MNDCMSNKRYLNMRYRGRGPFIMYLFGLFHENHLENCDIYARITKIVIEIIRILSNYHSNTQNSLIISENSPRSLSTHSVSLPHIDTLALNMHMAGDHWYQRLHVYASLMPSVSSNHNYQNTSCPYC